jgi:flagellar protein FliO/FliZ
MMSTGSMLSSLAWFIAILALIPLALWLLKRTPAGGAAASGPLRSIASLPLGPGQRLVTVEVGRGETRRWLVLGVTAQQINTLHEMAPLEVLPGEPQSVAPFSLLLERLKQRAKDVDAA